MTKLNWGILSTANIGIKRIIPAIVAGNSGVVAAIASRDAAKAARVAADFRIGRSYGDYQGLLDDPAIEAVYNPLPNHLHVPWTVKALDAGKHVLCEKPLALNAREAQAIVEARDRSGKCVIEAFMVRCHPQWHGFASWSARATSARSAQSNRRFCSRCWIRRMSAIVPTSAAAHSTTWAATRSLPRATCLLPSRNVRSP